MGFLTPFYPGGVATLLLFALFISLESWGLAALYDAHRRHKGIHFFHPQWEYRIGGMMVSLGALLLTGAFDIARENPNLTLWDIFIMVLTAFFTTGACFMWVQIRFTVVIPTEKTPVGSGVMVEEPNGAIHFETPETPLSGQTETTTEGG